MVGVGGGAADVAGENACVGKTAKTLGMIGSQGKSDGG